MAIDYSKGMRPNLYELMQGGGGGGGYVLPPATVDTLGGVKVGEGVNVEPDGTISVTDGDKVFVAEVNVTTFAEVREALEIGKTVLLRIEPDAAPVLRGVAVNKFDSVYVFAQFVSQEALGAGGKLVLSCITLDSNDNWGTSQAFVQKELVSGESLKTVNGQTLLGAGNIEIDGGGYVLPPATADTLGGVIVGETLGVGNDGTLNINNILLLTIDNEFNKKLSRTGRNAEFPFVMQMASENDSVITFTLQNGSMLADYAGEVHSFVEIDQNGNINVALTDENNDHIFEITPNGINIATHRNGAIYDGLKLNGIVTPIRESDATSKKYVDDSIQAIQKPFKEFTRDFTGLTSTNLLAITNATSASSQATGRFDVTLPNNEDYADYYIAGVSKFEFFNGDARVEATPVNIFTMNNSKTLRCGFKTPGTDSRQITKAAITVNVYRRF